MIRIYWNIGDAKDGLVWSVDMGDISSEINVKSIEIDGLIELKTNQDLSAEWPNPKGWLECSGCKMYVEDQIAKINTLYPV